MQRVLIPVLALACVGGCSVAAFPDTQPVAAGNTAFGLELYGKLREKDGNLICSPYSASAALAMTAAGAKGDTAAQMAQVLHLPDGPDKAAGPFGALTQQVAAANGKGCQLRIANSLFGQQNLGWDNKFLELTKSSFAAGLQPVDFSKPEEARKTINQWVEQQTQEKIKDLMPPSAVTPDTRLVLVNAVYFKGDWAAKFSPKMTAEGDFHTADGKAVKAPLMHQTGRFRLAGDDSMQALELPYQGDRLSMVVLLPRKADGLAEAEKGLTGAGLTGWLEKLKHESEVRVTLPKFKVTSDFDLIPPLKALGMTKPFGGEADFSGMASGEKLMITAVVQKAFVEVNEEGTEAAAATGVSVSRGAIGSSMPEFKADHPFLFVIRDNQTGTVLFIGRVTNPAA
jgi:serpin B